MRTERDILSSIEDLQRATKNNTERIARNMTFFFWVAVIFITLGALSFSVNFL